MRARAPLFAQETPVDPLEAFCATAPDADECRVYED
jgi:hypothetical protein